MPLWALLEGAVVSASFVAAPAVPVAVNVTGLPVRVPEVAVRVFVPAAGPRVQETAVAMPLALVDTGVVGFTVPPPAVTAKVTATFATGLLFASRTITDGGAPPPLPPPARRGHRPTPPPLAAPTPA